MHEGLVVDDRIRKVGIQVASRCDCCDSGAFEDMNHVLATREFVERIWSWCAIRLGMRNLARINWRRRVDSWHRLARGSTQKGQLLGIIPLVITWRLWWRQCKARMEGTFESIRSVWCSILYWVSWIALRLKKSKALSRRDEEILKNLQLPIKHTVPMAMKQVSWSRPKNGCFKLNVDGSSVGNPGPSGVGGVIRNDKGEFVCGFAKFTGHNTNNAVEVLGLPYGLRNVRDLDIHDVEIEIDSMLVINWLQAKRYGLWYLEDY
ncbi:uncharacterized protein LOC109020946 [Juglans regia]|uniref:Uncharacterized protein LOC109020946 n=1 Tax=Juglans regia TaxID=51240 RepID=A0A6P9ECL0_JUGRE|nr:uncharacterized protein LOC109020946 [Juglans regia]